MNIRLRQLRTFLAIVDTGSTSDAASLLGLTQSNVSKLLASFEVELGFKLFDRQGRRLHLSEQGRMFLNKARDSIESLEDIRRVAIDIRDNLGRRLRVAAIGPMAFGQLIPEALARFTVQHPEFSVSFETKLRSEIEDWVLNGHADIGFTLLPPGRAELSSKSLAPVKAVVVLPKGHSLSRLSALGPADIQNQRIVMPWKSARVRTLIEADFLNEGLQLLPHIETTNSISAAHLVAHGAGVAVIDPFSLTGVGQERIDVLPWAPSTPLTYGMIWPANRRILTHEASLFDLVSDVADSISQYIPARNL